MTERGPACAAWQEDLAGWLVAQLDPECERALDAHLESCATCRAEADSLLATTAVSLSVDPDDEVTLAQGPAEAVASIVGSEDPPAAMREHVVAAVSAERRARWRVYAGLAAVAGAVAAVVAVVSAGLLLRDSIPDVKGERVAFTVAPSGVRASVVVAPDDAGGSLVQLVATGMDPRVTYALWMSPPKGSWGDRVAAGTFRPDADGDVDVRLRCALAPDEYARVWATTPEGTVALDTQ